MKYISYFDLKIKYSSLTFSNDFRKVFRKVQKYFTLNKKNHYYKWFNLKSRYFLIIIF